MSEFETKEFNYLANKIILKNDEGTVLASIEWENDEKGRRIITHTFVDQSLRGMGIASRLNEALAKELERTSQKAVPVCPYAVTWFERHPEYSHLLEKE